jgi:hypothetical protein
MLERRSITVQSFTYRANQFPLVEEATALSTLEEHNTILGNRDSEG